MHDQPHSDDGEEEFVSKSQRKREADALQAMGAELVELNNEQLAHIPLDDNLRAAIDEARRIKGKGGRGGLRRQLQYIGKLMRKTDAEPIAEALDRLFNRRAEDAARFHRIERWRDRLLDEGDAALGELLEEQPLADRQQLRQLIRNARSEKLANKPPKSARELFRLLRELYEEE